ncbi:hypothetical protein AVEN_259090-1 [Araneus ventricosus]|uniref:Uncharacterized protein n=1 Tax=Araneus ventricosus TaxID=182803 RepID=A0A4Y2NEU9_ARAVE|nr:hypothetical protein AVEN_272770-1 [Araneus ventricosus]GBN37893.1 hypothetical protein AVEN_259090-1 [Araneus ventricosus]
MGFLPISPQSFDQNGFQKFTSNHSKSRFGLGCIQPGVFTPAVTKPTPPDTLTGSGGKATNGRDKTRREKEGFAPRAPPKIPSPKTRHKDVRPPFPIGQKSGKAASLSA